MVFTTMGNLSCRGQKHNSVPCSRCREILDYGLERTASCPFGEQKPFCSSCTIHSCSPEMREAVRSVMQYAGPRMMLHHPIAAVMHMLRKKR